RLPFDSEPLMTDNGSQSQESSPDGESQRSLTSRVVKSVGWVFAGKAFGRVLKLLQYVILARLLAPKDFGLFGIVMLAIGTLQTFSKTGFHAALIQRRDDTEAFLDTAWTVQAVRGVVLGVLLYVAAPGVAAFFDEPRAPALLRVMCISVMLGGLKNVGIIYFRKELKFHKQVLYNCGTALISLIVAIVLAYRLHSVWALIWAGLAGSASGVLLSYLIHPFRPRLSLEPGRARGLFSFGVWMLGTSIVVFIATKLDDALVGKMLGAGALGLYQMAFRLSNTPATEITHVTNAVMMPAYARVQDQTARLRRGFLSVLEFTMSFCLPLTAFLVIAAPVVVEGLLGSGWQGAIVPLQILAFAGLFRAFAATFGPLFVGTGTPRNDFRMNLVRMFVLAATIYPLTALWGLAGASLSVVLALMATCLAGMRALSITRTSLKMVAGRLLPGLALAVPTAGAALFGLALDLPGPVWSLVATTASVGGAFLLCAWLLGVLLKTGPFVYFRKALETIRLGRIAPASEK
ncbi:MAG: lipopolysaccharide biosynthesis protein, partial [Candidatus Brocadiia bacterium]